MLREVENLYWYDGPLLGVHEDVTETLSFVPDDWYPGDCYLDCRNKCKCEVYKDV